MSDAFDKPRFSEAEMGRITNALCWQIGRWGNALRIAMERYAGEALRRT